ncbi:MAG: DNA polymerase III subunit delta [Endomicrobium sp.]|jgi:DNA polymerase-3 subunit delta|nr:DNA polymerase III subunit delta [Endomicrobium sp.]
MSILKIQDFLSSSQKIYPVYLFAGEESYLLDVCLGKIANLFVVDNLNKEVFYAAESSAEDVLNAIQTIPLLSDKKVIIVKGVDEMKGSDAERLSDYLSNVIKTSNLVLLYHGNYKKEAVLKRKELLNKCIVSKNCVLVDCRKQYENEVKEFIKNEFNKRGKTISYDVILKIIDENGVDLLNVVNEIEKLSLFVGVDKKNITQEDLEKISGYTKEVNIYTLASNIEERELKKSLFVLEKLLEQGEEPIVILSIIFQTVRKMLNAKSMLEEQNMSVPEIASVLKIHNFYTEHFFVNLKKHSINTLKESLNVILKADMAIKTGSGDVTLALEEIVLFICT